MLGKPYKWLVCICCETMDEDICIEDEVSCMLRKAENKESIDEQLAFIMHRFNLDWETVECMPAFDEHRKKLIPPSPDREIEK